jgi:hypothetical protein
VQLQFGLVFLPQIRYRYQYLHVVLYLLSILFLSVHHIINSHASFTRAYEWQLKPTIFTSISTGANKLLSPSFLAYTYLHSFFLFCTDQRTWPPTTIPTERQGPGRDQGTCYANQTLYSSMKACLKLTIYCSNMYVCETFPSSNVLIVSQNLFNIELKGWFIYFVFIRWRRLD